MKVKYEIFISSTSNDMLEERRAVIQQILTEYHIPSNAEDFITSAHENTIELIKEQINACDIFLIILGGRYGDIIKNGNGKGKSYTEYEYEYAKKKNKPIIAIIIKDSYLKIKKNNAQKNGEDYYINDNTLQYNSLLKKIKDNGKTVGFYSSIENLKSEISKGIKRIVDESARYNLKSKGWIRNDEVETSNPFTLFHRDDFRINNAISKAKKDIFISGASLASMTPYVDVLRNFPDNKTIKLLSLDYGNENVIKQFGNMIFTDYDNLKRQNMAFNEIVKNDNKICINKNIEIRKSPFLMPIAYIGVDLGENFNKISENSYIKVQHYLHKTSGIECPNYIVRPKDELFNIFLEQISILWNNAI